MKPWLLPCVLGALLLPAGCTRHKVELDVKPIHITMDINVRVQRELDDIFDQIESEAEPAPPEAKEGEKPPPAKAKDAEQPAPKPKAPQGS